MVKTKKSRRISPKEARPRAGGRVSVALAHGFACDVDLGERALRADLSRGRGGTGTGPDPEQLLRASLASSLVIAYRSWASHLGVELRAARLELDVETEPSSAELAPELGARWSALHGRIRLESAATDAELERVIELAHAHDARLASLSAGIPFRFELRIERGRSGSV